MQLGTLLIPILGGYIFIISCYLTRYIAVRDTGYHLFFKSAIAGSAMFALAYTLEPVIKSQAELQAFWQSNFAAGHIGTSVLSLLLGFVSAAGINIFCNKEKYVQKAAEGRGDRLELMLANSSDMLIQVEITLKTGKSYIGYVVHSPFSIHGRSDVEILLTASGYRKPDTQELILTTHYSSFLDSSIRNLSAEHFRIAIHMSEVISVRLFDPKLYSQIIKYAERGIRNLENSESSSHDNRPV